MSIYSKKKEAKREKGSHHVQEKEHAF